MLTFRWSWIFTLNTLLVPMGYAAHNSRVTKDIIPRDSGETSLPVSTDFISHHKDVAIAIGVIVVVILIATVVALLFILRHRRAKARVNLEDGPSEKGSTKDRKSIVIDWWKLDHHYDIPPRVDKIDPENKASRLDRLRLALMRSRSQMEEKNPSPAHTPPSPPKKAVDRPLPTAPNPRPRYPIISENGGPPPLQRAAPIIPTRALTRALHSADSSRSSRRKVQIPPQVHIHGGQVPGLAARKTGSVSPSRRAKDWLSIHQFKHPFMPVKGVGSRLPPISAPIPQHGTGIWSTYVEQAGLQYREASQENQGRRVPVPKNFNSPVQQGTIPVIPMPIPSHVLDEVQRDMKPILSPQRTRSRESPPPI